MSEVAQESDSVPDGYDRVQLGPKSEFIPSEWKIEPISSWLTTLETGGRPKTSERSESDSVLSIGGAHISDRSFDLDEPVYISGDYYENLNSGKIEEDDILLVKDGATIGKSMYVDSVPEDCAAVNSHVYILRVDSEKYDPRFLYHFIRSRTGLDQILRLATGSAQAGLNRTFQRAVKVPTPPLSEQHRIANILSTANKYLEETSGIIGGYEELRRGFLQDALSHGLNKSSTRDVEIPISPRKWTVSEDWEIKTVSEVTTKITDGVHQTPNYVEKGIPFLKAGDLRRDSYNWEEFPQISQDAFESQQFTAKRGDLLLAKNGSPKTIGVTKLVDWDTPFSFFVSICLLRPETDQVTPRYLQAALMSKMAKDQMSNMSQTGTVTNLHLEEIRSISIPIPPITEQKEIVDKWQKVENKISQEKETKDLLNDLKSGLMQDLLTGKVRAHTD